MCFTEFAGERSLNDFAREGYIKLPPAEIIAEKLSAAVSVKIP
jgi:hypothetical protein